LAVGLWPLAIGYWLLAIGFWLLALSVVVSFTAHAYLIQTSLDLFQTIRDYDNS